MHADLIGSALKLACVDGQGTASDTDYRRALSTAYYAAFHFIVRECADLLCNDGNGQSIQRAWMQVYRTIQHGDIRSACNHAADERMGFPEGVRSFAALFPTLKRVREAADYDPIGNAWNENYILAKIGEVEEAINAFSSVDRKHRQAFAVLVAFGSRQRS